MNSMIGSKQTGILLNQSTHLFFYGSNCKKSGAYKHLIIWYNKKYDINIL